MLRLRVSSVNMRHYKDYEQKVSAGEHRMNIEDVASYFFNFAIICLRFKFHLLNLCSNSDLPISLNLLHGKAAFIIMSVLNQ